MNFDKVKTNVLLCKPTKDTNILEVFNSIQIRNGDYHNEVISFDVVTIVNFWDIKIQNIKILYSIVHDNQIVILGSQSFYEKNTNENHENGFYDTINLMERFPVRDFPLKGSGIYQVVGHLVTNLDTETIEGIREKIESGNIEDTEEYMSNVFNFEVF